MELINEINQIKKIMGLTPLNEAAGGWLDDLFNATKLLLTNTIKTKSTLKSFINDGLTKFPSLKTAITIDSALGTSLKKELIVAKNSLAKTDPNRLLINARIKEIDALLPKPPKTPRGVDNITLDLKLINDDAEAIFNIANKKLTPAQSMLLNNAAKNINNLSPLEMVKVNNELKKLGAGPIQDAITNLKNAEDFISKSKGVKYQKVLDKIVEYTNITTGAVAGVNKSKLLKATGGILLLLLALGLWSTYKDGFIGKFISAGGSFAKDAITPEVPSTPDNQGGSNNNGKGKYD